MIDPHRVYYGSEREGFWSPTGWYAMGRQLIGARDLTWRLFLRDFQARYKQNIAGVLWAVVSPLLAVAGFVLLQRSGVLDVGEVQVPYPAFALLGLTIWQVFSGITTACTGALANAGDMVRKINFPREALVLGAAGHAIVDLTIQTALLSLVFWYYRVTPAWTVVFLPLALLPLLLGSLGVGMVFSAMNAVARDVGALVSVAIGYLIFVTPVLYPRPASGPLWTLMAWNPLTSVIETARDLVLEGRITQPLAFGWTSLLFFAVFLLGWRLFHLLARLIAERV